ncbi:hypothetical protein [Pedobacter sp. BMA]|uniref:hypothetical protein n=1 Tax=Pedobacter sp. BMA TaxID=1663685 RepID=UPI00064B635F|nr:hypothetical protein [Pedobacter sp. BMA]KLT64689.1 hypothetical protein AB669_13095 [Pedobacter sp. BMA]
MKLFRLSLVIFSFLSLGVRAQFDTNSNKLSVPTGKAITEPRIDNVKGNPNMFKDWSKGSVSLAGETGSYTNLDLMYDQVKDKLYFKSGADKLEFTKPVRAFTIAEGSAIHTFKSGFPGIEKNDQYTMYEVLTDGNIKLLKKVTKDIITTKGYNEVTEMRFDSRIKYYVLDGQTIYEIKPNKKGVAAAIAEKGLKATEQFNANLPLKNEADLVAFFTKL